MHVFGGQDFLDDLVRTPDGSVLGVRRLDMSLIEDPEFQRAYPAEAAAQRGLDVPSVATPVSCLTDEVGSVVGVVRRYVPGCNLAAMLEAFPAGMDAQTITVVAMDVLTALAALHSVGTAHQGDLASRVFVDENGRCVLVDVGLTPRSADVGVEAAIAWDLELFANLVTDRMTGQGTVPEPIRSVIVGRGDAGAAELLDMLSQAAAGAFDTDWDARARERLAALVEPPAIAPRVIQQVPAAAGTASSRPVAAIVLIVLVAVAIGLGLYLAIPPRHHATARKAAEPMPAAPIAMATTYAATTPTPSPTTTPPTTVFPQPTTPAAAPVPTNSPTPIATTPPTSYEAADATLGGGAQIVECYACSHGEKVRLVYNDSTLTFTVAEQTAGTRTLTIFTTGGDSDQYAVMAVNGIDTLLDFPGSGRGNWENVQSFATTVTLDAGENTIEFSNPYGYAPDFDRIVL